jgi:hypothetical protein
MNLQRTATIVIVGGALAAWLAGAATSNRDVTEPIAFKPAPIDARGAELAGEIARLHERLRPAAAPRQPGRNLFTFRASQPPAVPAVPIVEAPPAAPAGAAASTPQPALKLEGIAEDPGREGPVRTAIISVEGQLFLVKEGENVTPRYRVAAVSVDVVELVDLGNGLSRRLALK